MTMSDIYRCACGFETTLYDEFIDHKEAKDPKCEV